MPVRRGRRRVTVMRREESDRVVAPVVGQAALDEDRLGDGLVYRHQLDRGHAEPLQVLDDDRGRQARVAASQLRRDARMTQGEAANMSLVDQCFVVRGTKLLIA